MLNDSLHFHEYMYTYNCMCVCHPFYVVSYYIISFLTTGSVDQLAPVEARGAQTMATVAVAEPIPTAVAENTKHISGAMSVISDNTQTSTETGSTEVVQSSQVCGGSCNR